MGNVRVEFEIDVRERPKGITNKYLVQFLPVLLLSESGHARKKEHDNPQVNQPPDIHASGFSISNCRCQQAEAKSVRVAKSTSGLPEVGIGIIWARVRSVFAMFKKQINHR